MKKLFQVLVTALLCLWTTFLFSQNRSVSGVVTSAVDEQPLVGVSADAMTDFA